MTDFTVDDRNWGKPEEGATIYIEPHNRDDRGLLLKRGQRVRIHAKDGQALVLDRKHLEAAIALLEREAAAE